MSTANAEVGEKKAKFYDSEATLTDDEAGNDEAGNDEAVRMVSKMVRQHEKAEAREREKQEMMQKIEDYYRDGNLDEPSKCQFEKIIMSRPGMWWYVKRSIKFSSTNSEDNLMRPLHEEKENEEVEKGEIELDDGSYYDAYAKQILYCCNNVFRVYNCLPRECTPGEDRLASYNEQQQEEEEEEKELDPLVKCLVGKDPKEQQSLLDGLKAKLMATPVTVDQEWTPQQAEQKKPEHDKEEEEEEDLRCQDAECYLELLKLQKFCMLVMDDIAGFIGSSHDAQQAFCDYVSESWKFLSLVNNNEAMDGEIQALKEKSKECLAEFANDSISSEKLDEVEQFFQQIKLILSMSQEGKSKEMLQSICWVLSFLTTEPYDPDEDKEQEEEEEEEEEEEDCCMFVDSDDGYDLYDDGTTIDSKEELRALLLARLKNRGIEATDKKIEDALFDAGLVDGWGPERVDQWLQTEFEEFMYLAENDKQREDDDRETAFKDVWKMSDGEMDAILEYVLECIKREEAYLDEFKRACCGLIDLRLRKSTGPERSFVKLLKDTDNMLKAVEMLKELWPPTLDLKAKVLADPNLEKQATITALEQYPQKTLNLLLDAFKKEAYSTPEMSNMLRGTKEVIVGAKKRLKDKKNAEELEKNQARAAAKAQARTTAKILTPKQKPFAAKELCEGRANTDYWGMVFEVLEVQEGPNNSFVYNLKHRDTDKVYQSVKQSRLKRHSKRPRDEEGKNEEPQAKKAADKCAAELLRELRGEPPASLNP